MVISFCGAGFADCPELVDNISVNYDYWKQKLEEEHETGQRLCFTRRAATSGRLSPSGGRQISDRQPRSSSAKRVPGIVEEESVCNSPDDPPRGRDQSQVVSQNRDQSQAVIQTRDQSRGAALHARDQSQATS